MNKNYNSINSLREKYLDNDTDFDKLFPDEMKLWSRRHFTPLHIAELATSFLTSEPSKILDIGSGVGKFCLAGACYAPNSVFYGIEQRKNMTQFSNKALRKLGLNNVHFIHGNFMDIDFSSFDHFYFYNSFYENIDDLDRIDDEVEYSIDLYKTYFSNLIKALEQMPMGTKIATYYSFDEEIPKQYDLVETLSNGNLKFWIKNTDG